MKARIITSTVYVLAVVALCAGKWLIPGGYGALLFDALFCAIAAIGAFELIRAFGTVSLLQRAVTITFCALSAPMYALMSMLGGDGWTGLAGCLAAGVVVVCILFVADHSRSDLKSTLSSLFVIVYVGLLTGLMGAINHLENNSMLAILFLFVSVPFADAGAFLIGISLGKVATLKLAPSVSPNKTVIGFFGGLIGGMGGAVAAYYVFVALGGQPAFSTALPGWAFSLIVGCAAALATQFGDLFESAIKRSVGIKDMGRLLPGHGGVLDRFDGTLFAGIVILLSFVFAA